MTFLGGECATPLPSGPNVHVWDLRQQDTPGRGWLLARDYPSMEKLSTRVANGLRLFCIPLHQRRVLVFSDPLDIALAMVMVFLHTYRDESTTELWHEPLAGTGNASLIRTFDCEQPAIDGQRFEAYSAHEEASRTNAKELRSNGRHARCHSGAER